VPQVNSRHWFGAISIASLQEPICLAMPIS
jgi:hypothetical protein